LQKTFWHQTVKTEQVESYMTEQAGIDLSKIFDQYLRTTKIPLLQYQIDGNRLSFKYDRVVNGFAMSLRVMVNGKEVSITPTESLQTQAFPDEIKTVQVNRNYYVDSEVMK
jgi:aminopeptidase N